jgi:Holliday junction resolvasome RuvABC ATP-dependent DNA helicase subunit
MILHRDVKNRWRDALRTLTDQDIEDLIVAIKHDLYISLEIDRTDASEVAIKIRHTTQIGNRLLTIKRS